MANENAGKFHPGTRFRGNVNGKEMEIVRIENSTAIIMDLHTKEVFHFGLQALEKCDVEVTGWQMNSG